MVDTYVSNGLQAVEVAWDAPGIWGGPRARTLACRFATVAQWIHGNLHQPGPGMVFIAQGTSGGAAQIAFGLAYYGIDSFVTLASLSGGPPYCPLCTGPLPTREPILSGTPKLSYPNTTVRLFLGVNDPNSDGTVDSARAYYDAVASQKSLQMISNTGHDVEATSEGQAALRAAVQGALGLA